ncbi:uncharacterized protein LOC126662098 [Mercurialis annua]|uniref:uncharacterized protein LOC126662098 n=1 Tax=Mercurialis annua TaxID=3986 RepID=UPI00215E60D8|nr:uncharacterized protein LOC126662098 [Mercurialis annua]
MSNWFDLHTDLLTEIATRLNSIEDYIRFGAVCKTWRSVARTNNFNKLCVNQSPWFMLQHTGQFFALSNPKEISIKFQTQMRYLKQLCVSSKGWIFMNKWNMKNKKDDDFISLVHPLSLSKIQLPSMIRHKPINHTIVYVSKGVLSSSPGSKSDFKIMITCVYYDK